MTKKIGGVRSTADAPRSSHRKVVGAVREPTERSGITPGHRRPCPDKCEGEWHHGFWQHSQDCFWADVRYEEDGFTPQAWKCAYGCQAVEISKGRWTHPWDCRHWGKGEDLPF